MKNHIILYSLILYKNINLKYVELSKISTSIGSSISSISNWKWTANSTNHTWQKVYAKNY